MTARLSAPTFVLATLLALACSAAGAQTTSGAPATAAPAPTTDAAAPLVETAPATKTKDAKVEHLVTEDSQVRIEETRVRGVTKKIVVHSKIPGVGSYEIQPRDPGVDPENDHAAGMRLFNFSFGS